MEQGLMSKKLATIITDVDVLFDAEDLKICPPDEEKIREIFTELEFRNIAKRVLGEEIVITNSSVPSTDGQLDLFGATQTPEQKETVETSELKSLAKIGRASCRERV